VLNSVTQGFHQNLLGSFDFYAYCNITKTLYNAINGLVHTHYISFHSFGWNLYCRLPPNVRQFWFWSHAYPYYSLDGLWPYMWPIHFPDTLLKLDMGSSLLPLYKNLVKLKENHW